MSFRTFGPLLCGGLLLATAAFARDAIGSPGSMSRWSRTGRDHHRHDHDQRHRRVYFQHSLPAGTYTLRVQIGRAKGKILKTITVRKAGRVGGTLVTKGNSAAAK
jgi:hypothetical protein